VDNIFRRQIHKVVGVLLTGLITVMPGVSSAERSEVDYNNREYDALFHAARANNARCLLNAYMEKISDLLSDRLSTAEFGRQYREYLGSYGIEDLPSTYSNCFIKARDLFTPPYTPSSSLHSRTSVRLIEKRACDGRNEGGVKGRRRWATCANFCEENPRCVSFEMGRVAEGWNSKARICTISYSCTPERATYSDNYDLWVIRRD
jgi:hypothetical protein